MKKTHLLLTAALGLILAGCGGTVSTSSSSNGGGGSGATTGTGASGGAGATGGAGGSTEDFVACDANTVCILTSPGCCQSCTGNDLSQYVAINAAKADAYFEHVCPEPTPCPGCDPLIDPNFFAYCEAGSCVAADVRTHAVSACATDADCRLRNGASCCEGCGPSELSVIAVATTANPQLASLVCVGDVSCVDCEPQYPLETMAVCGANGHCEVVTP